MPPEGPLAKFGANWVGLDAVTCRDAPHFDLPGLHDVTMTPRKYRFHGNLKPPFRLKDGQTLEAVEQAATALADSLGPATCDGLKLAQLGRFPALTPFGPLDRLQRVAAACERDLDGFRGPTGEAQIAQRCKAGLTARQEALLTAWGYRYVFDEFRFHLALSVRLRQDGGQGWTTVLQGHLPDLPAHFTLDQMAHCGERRDGRFELIHLYTLTG